MRLVSGSWVGKRFVSWVSMSRIGRKIIRIPEGVRVDLNGRQLSVSGPRGSLQRSLPAELSLKLDSQTLQLASSHSSRKLSSLWGLHRSLIANMVEGVTQGFQKELEFTGVGYKVKKDGLDIVFSLGFSHPIRWTGQPGIDFEVREDTRLIISGIDRELVGQEAARIRALKKPEPYKGKGIKYVGEVIRRKAGKVGKVGASLGAK